MKLNQIQMARSFWEPEPSVSSLSLELGSKRLRLLEPSRPFNLSGFIRPESGPRRSADNRTGSPQALETHPGGTRWNPAQEQIGILEMLYKGGLRTPNAQQIEQITEQLSKYGKIEGKNVFYWFQNHKARERQKQKRTTVGVPYSPRSPQFTTASSLTPISLDLWGLSSREEREERSPMKKTCSELRSSGCDLGDNRSCRSTLEDGGKYKTLELFPLTPEGRWRL